MMCRLVRSTEGIIRLWLPTRYGWWLVVCGKNKRTSKVSVASMAGRVFYWLIHLIGLLADSSSKKASCSLELLKLNFAL